MQLKINKTKKFRDIINYTVLTDILLKMDNTEKEKVHIKTLNKCIYLPTFFNNHGDLNIVILFFKLAICEELFFFVFGSKLCNDIKKIANP